MKLTQKQEKFIALIRLGKEEEEAYRTAYERSGLTDREVRKLIKNVWKSKKMQLAKMTLLDSKKEIITKEQILEQLVQVQNENFKRLQKGENFRNVIDAYNLATQEINKMMGYYAEIEYKKEAIKEELKLKRERLEFDKSKIKKDNEDLQKENAKLLRDLISNRTV